MAGPFIVFGIETLLIRTPAPVGRPVFSSAHNGPAFAKAQPGRQGISMEIGFPNVAARTASCPILFTV
jgi:hypothetical protein